MRAHRGSWVVFFFFFTKCVCHMFCPRAFHYPRGIFMFSALSFIPSLYLSPVGAYFFICEHPQIYSPRRIILLIRYSHFYALHVFFPRSIIDILTTLTTFRILTIIHVEFIQNGGYTRFFSCSLKSKYFADIIVILGVVLRKMLCLYKTLLLKLFLFNTLIVSKNFI